MADWEKRKEIWLCLSDSYLDVALSDTDYHRMVKLFESTHMSLNELMAIDLLEVYPVLKSNLISPAGVWTGFQEEWLYASCKPYYRAKKGGFDAILIRWRLLLSPSRRDYWKRIAVLMHQKLA